MNQKVLLGAWHYFPCIYPQSPSKLLGVLMSEKAVASEKIKKFFEDQGYGFCLPFLNKTLSEREINKFAEYIRGIGLEQCWLHSRIIQENHAPSQKDILIVSRERAVEGKSFFLQIFKYLAERFSLPFLVYKEDSKTLYKIPLDPDSKDIFCNYQPLTFEVGHEPHDMMVKILGSPCSIENVFLHLHSIDGFNGALLRENIRDKIIEQGASYFDHLFAKKLPTIAKLGQTFYQDSAVSDLWRQCPSSSEIDNFFVADSPIYRLACGSDDKKQFDSAIQLANLELLLDALELNYILAERKNQKYVFLQSICPLEDGQLISNIISLLTQMPIYATITTLISGSDAGQSESDRIIRCHIGRTTLSVAAKRAYFNVIARYRPAAFGSYLNSLAKAKHREQLKSGELVKINPLAAAALEEKCGCFDLEKLDREKSEQLIKILSDAGYGVQSLSRDQTGGAPEFLVLKQGGESDNLFIQLLLSCMVAASDKSGLFRTFYGPLFQIAKEDQISLICNVYEEDAKNLDEIFNRVFPVREDEIIHIKTVQPVTGMRLITKRALLTSTLQEYGQTAIKKLLGEEVEPEPFTIKNASDGDTQKSSLPAGSYFVAGGKPFKPELG